MDLITFVAIAKGASIQAREKGWNITPYVWLWERAKACSPIGAIALKRGCRQLPVILETLGITENQYSNFSWGLCRAEPLEGELFDQAWDNAGRYIAEWLATTGAKQPYRMTFLRRPDGYLHGTNALSLQDEESARRATDDPYVPLFSICGDDSLDVATKLRDIESSQMISTSTSMTRQRHGD